MFYKHPPKGTIPKEEKPSYENLDGDRIVEGPCFLYEFLEYHFIKEGKKFRRAELYSNKLVKSDKEVRSKYLLEYFPNKKKPELIIEKSINMLMAPQDYIKSNNLPTWVIRETIKVKKNGKSTVQNKNVRRLRK
jgi:hypothetical protein